MPELKDQLEKYLKQIENKEENDNKQRDTDTLRLFFDALSKVKPEYYGSIDTGEYKKQKLERPFCYELYFQLKCRFSGLGYMVSGEIGKDPKMDFTNEKKQLYLGQKYNVKNKKYIFPDIVIHKSQDNHDFENQKLIIEAKYSKSGDKAIVKDLIKLINAIHVFNFQFAVFLSIKNTFNELVEQIKEIEDITLGEKDATELAKYLLIVNINSISEIEFSSLHGILQNHKP